MRQNKPMCCKRTHYNKFLTAIIAVFLFLVQQKKGEPILAPVDFFHGSRVFESAETPLLVRLNRTAVVGLIGTAPDADDSRFPFDLPVQILRPQDALKLGKKGTLPKAIDTIFDVVTCPIIVVRIKEADTVVGLWANAIGDQTRYSGVHAFRQARSRGLYKPRLLCAPGLTQAVPTDGIASINVQNGGSGYKAGTTKITIKGSGSGAEAEAVIEDTTTGAITSIIVKKNGSGYSGTAEVVIEGDGKNATAEANIGATMNPVVAELIGVAEKLRAMVYVDGPDTTDEEAVLYRSLINSDRVAICDPKGLKFDTVSKVNVPEPSSPQFAAQQALMDLTQGFWWAGSNVPVKGFVGTNRPVEYPSVSNYLNENRINTIVNIDNEGFRLWGVWTCASDLMWQFIPVRRCADIVNENLEKALLTFIDKPFSQANLKFIVEGGRSFLRNMEGEGAILPGWDVWLLDTNTKEDMAQGILKLGIKFEPPAPMVEIRTTMHRNIISYEILLNQTTKKITDGSLSA